MENETFIIWSQGSGKPKFVITKPFDGNPYHPLYLEPDIVD